MAAKPPEPRIRIERTLHQICTADGTPYQAYATSCVWGKEADPYPKTDGNHVEPLLSGEAYYQQLHDAIGKAQKSLCMLGWQINWDVPLITGGDNLYDLLVKAATDPARSQLKIYILPWDDSAPVTTYDDQTVAVVNAINDLVKGPRRVFAQLAKEHPASAEGMDMYYSHHQKLVVIDDQLAFMGGIDVCWGRRDNGSYTLDAQGRHGGDVYNGCIAPLGQATGDSYIDGDLIDQPERIQTRGGAIPTRRSFEPRRNSDKARHYSCLPAAPCQTLPGSRACPGRMCNSRSRAQPSATWPPTLCCAGTWPWRTTTREGCPNCPCRPSQAATPSQAGIACRCCAAPRTRWWTLKRRP